MKYLWYQFENFYSTAECKEILDTVALYTEKSIIDRPGQFKNVNSEIFNTNHEIVKKLNKLFHHVKDWNESFFGFDLFDRIPYTGNLNVYSGENNEYGYHSDGTEMGTSRDIKLTAILNVSQKEYQGGQFQIFTGKDQTIDFLDKTGSLIVFPSFLYHRVAPVTHGERISISFWFYGPNWK